MAARAIEGGIIFLLFFTPLAFGGVKEWAVGVIQITAGTVFALWIWNRGRLTTGRDGFLPAGFQRRTLAGVLWPLGLFLAWVGLQMAPLPPSLLARVAPATHEVYAATVPGFAEGDGWQADDLDSWLRSRADDAGPAPPLPAPTETLLAPADSTAAGVPSRMGAWRSLSIDRWRTARGLTIFLSYAALFVVAADFLRSRDRFRRLCVSVVLSATLVSLLGILQRFTSGGRVYWRYPDPSNDFFGPFFNRNSYAALAGAVLPLALGLALAAWRRWRRGEPEAAGTALLYSFSAGLIGIGIGLSLSRGGILSAGLSVALLVAILIGLGRKGRELTVLASTLVVSAGALAWLGSGAVFSRLGTLSEGLGTPSLAMRLAAWKRALALVADHAFTGTGLGTFQLAFRGYTPPGRLMWETAHNEYLELLCDVGLIGAALLLAAAVAWSLRVMRPGVLGRGSAPYAFAGLVAGLAGLMLHSAVSSNLQVPAVGTLVAILMGALVAMVERREARQAMRGGGGGRRARRRADDRA